MHSMTGFGRATSGPIVAEVRSLNHRFAEVSVRLPRELAAVEDRVRRLTASAFARGRIEVHLALDAPTASVTALRVDKPLARAYYEALKELAIVLGLSGEPDLSLLAALPGVVSLREAAADAEALWPDVEGALGSALAAAAAMRRAEGSALANDLLAGCDELATIVSELAARAPGLGAALRARLARRLDELLLPGAVDPGRLEAEVALLAERAAIDEEIVRLDSHLAQFRSATGELAPVGRKLDFIVQEIHREVNTIGSKASDGEIARAVIAAKGVVEKLREQVQNVE